MRRAFAILKYLPAALCGLLVVAWVVSLNITCGFEPTHNGGFGALIANANLVLLRANQDGDPVWIRNEEQYFQSSWLGSYMLGRSVWFPPVDIVELPIPALLTVLFPLAIGPFTRFRFPLWSYFAWTALVAAELAYYLRA
jgi:hypothetical protein